MLYQIAVELAAILVAEAPAPNTVALDTKEILAPFPKATPLLPFTEVPYPISMGLVKLKPVTALIPITIALVLLENAPLHNEMEDAALAIVLLAHVVLRPMANELVLLELAPLPIANELTPLVTTVVPIANERSPLAAKLLQIAMAAVLPNPIVTVLRKAYDCVAVLVVAPLPSAR